MRKTAWLFGLLLLPVRRRPRSAADYPAPVQGDYVVRGFPFDAGGSLAELKMHYRTIGQPQKDASGRVATPCSCCTARPAPARSSSGPISPASCLARASCSTRRRTSSSSWTTSATGSRASRATACAPPFPKYGYRDMVTAQYRLLTEGLGVNHLRLVIGTSMGGMHAWLWGEMYPDFTDALMPLASLPAQISGRNRMWRRIAIDAIRNDPAWQGGRYIAQPRGPAHGRGHARARQQQSGAPPARVAHARGRRPAGSTDYVGQLRDAPPMPTTCCMRSKRRGTTTRRPALERITAPLLAVNFADDLVNPPELGILEREISRVPKGRAVVMPLSEQTRGHGSHTIAGLWKHLLAELLASSDKRSG